MRRPEANRKSLHLLFFEAVSHWDLGLHKVDQLTRGCWRPSQCWDYGNKSPPMAFVMSVQGIKLRTSGLHGKHGTDWAALVWGLSSVLGSFSLCSTGWPRTQCIDLTGLELTARPQPPGAGLKACVTCLDEQFLNKMPQWPGNQLESLPAKKIALGVWQRMGIVAAILTVIFLQRARIPRS